METSRSWSTFLLLLLNVLLAALVCWFWLARRQAVAVAETQMGLPRIVARVNGEPIFSEELLSAAHVAGPAATDEELARSLKSLIAERVILQQAPASTPAPDWLRSCEEQFRGAADFREALAQARLTPQTLQERLEKTRGAEQWLLARTAQAASEDQMQSYYERYRAAFTWPEVAHLQHFAAIFPPSHQPVEMLATADRSKDALQRLRDGIPFPQLIDALSDDPAKKKTQGDLSWTTRERMEPALVKAAFSLPLNTVSTPLETRFGFHLLKVLDRRERREMTYEEAAPEIEARLGDILRRAKTRELVAELRSSAQVEILAERLR